MNHTKRHYKNLIIGFGKGGKTLASFLASQKESVAIVEQSNKMYGGTCINIACIPTKSLIVNAEKGVPYNEALVIKEKLTSSLRQKNYDKLNQQDTVDVITGKASFVSNNEIKVVFLSGEDIFITADRIFINTGAEPRIPKITGIDSKKIFTSTSIMEQQQKPESLIVVGGGFIGLEFADMFTKFGSKVTILDVADEFLPKEDDDVRTAIYQVLTDKGIDIINGIQLQQIEDINDNTVKVHFTHEGDNKAIDANAVLLATGRNPNTEGLNLQAAGIKINERGYIIVNEELKTNIPNIWAIGDINGGPQFTYISLDDFRIIKNQLTNHKYTSIKQRGNFPSCVFITPPLAQAGLREKEAIEQGYKIKVATLPANAIPKAAILKETRGLLKAIIDADTNKILGCTLFCAEAHEFINMVQLAIKHEIPYTIIRDTIYTHPTMTEALNDLFQNVPD